MFLGSWTGTIVFGNGEPSFRQHGCGNLQSILARFPGSRGMTPHRASEARGTNSRCAFAPCRGARFDRLS